MLTKKPLQSGNQIIASPDRQTERMFDKSLLLVLVLILITLLAFFAFLGYGIVLLFSEPEDTGVSQYHKRQIGLSVKGAQFSLTFNGKALSEFPFGEEEGDFSPNVYQQPQPHKSTKPYPYQVRLLGQPNDPTKKEVLQKNALQNFQVYLKKDTIIMRFPFTFAETKKTITIEENLTIEDNRLVADVNCIKIGKLPIPKFLSIYLLDSLGPRFANLLAEKFGSSESEQRQSTITYGKNSDSQFSKMIMPPVLLVLFGPTDFLQELFPEKIPYNKSPEQLQSIPVNSVSIDHDRLVVTADAVGIKQLINLTTLILGLKWEDLGK